MHESAAAGSWQRATHIIVGRRPDNNFDAGAGGSGVGKRSTAGARRRRASLQHGACDLVRFPFLFAMLNHTACGAVVREDVGWLGSELVSGMEW
jgi:hypothetical protein